MSIASLHQRCTALFCGLLCRVLLAVRLMSAHSAWTMWQLRALHHEVAAAACLGQRSAGGGLPVGRLVPWSTRCPLKFPCNHPYLFQCFLIPLSAVSSFVWAGRVSLQHTPFCSRAPPCLGTQSDSSAFCRLPGQHSYGGPLRRGPNHGRGIELVRPGLLRPCACTGPLCARELAVEGPGDQSIGQHSCK